MATPLLPYYQKLPPSIGHRFQNLDDDDVFAECDRALRSPTTRNFIVDFGGAPEDHGQAWCAVDIDPDDHVGIRALLSAKVHQKNERTGGFPLGGRWLTELHCT